MTMVAACNEINMPQLERALAVRPMPIEVEQAFGRCIVAGRDAARKLEGPDVSSVERAALEAEACLGRWARDRLVEYNRPLVLSIARRFMERGLDVDDLRQEGIIGLIRAIDGFDWTRGLRLSTYATFWIRQSIARAIADRARMIRLPVNVQETLGDITSVSLALAAKLGRQPRLEEIAAAAGLPPERAAEIVRAAGDAISIELATGPHGRPVEETIGDGAPGPEELACRTMIREELDAALDAALTPREAEVIRLRYGLADGVEWTLETIGARLGVTRERARQLEASAMAKLRAAAEAGLLRGDEAAA